MNRAAAAALLARRARENLLIFVRVAWGWVPGQSSTPIWVWPMTLYCLMAEQVLRGRLDVAVFNGPPGGGKSSIVSRMAYPWAVLDDPTLRAASITHTIEGLGQELHNDRRALIAHPAYQALIPLGPDGRPCWSVDPRNNNKTKLQLVGGTSRAGGWIQLAAPTPDSSGAGLTTGMHPDVHLVDDLLKMGDEHTSAMAAANKYLIDTMGTRFPSHQPERIIAGSQVIDALDHTQALLDAYPHAAHVVLPMEFDPDHPAAGREVDLGAPSPLLARAFRGDQSLAALRDEHIRAGVALRAGRLVWCDPRSLPGELLMPDLMPRARVDRKKLRKRVWLLNYQQRRIEAGAAALVEPSMWPYWTDTPTRPPDDIVVACDPQSGRGRVEDRGSPDWTVIYVGARWGSDVYLLEEFRAQVGTTDTCRALFLLFKRWGARKGRVEDAGAGPSCVDNLDGVLMGLELVPPKKSTPWRVEYIMPVIEARQIYLPAPGAARPALLAPGAPWPGVDLRTDDHALPTTLRQQHGGVFATLPPPRVWVPQFVEEFETSARPDDRQDGVAHLVMPWVGVVHQPSPAPTRRAPRRSRPSLAAQYGIV